MGQCTPRHTNCLAVVDCGESYHSHQFSHINFDNCGVEWLKGWSGTMGGVVGVVGGVVYV